MLTSPTVNLILKKHGSSSSDRVVTVASIDQVIQLASTRVARIRSSKLSKFTTKQLGIGRSIRGTSLMTELREVPQGIAKMDQGKVKSNNKCIGSPRIRTIRSSLKSLPSTNDRIQQNWTLS